MESGFLWRGLQACAAVKAGTNSRLKSTNALVEPQVTALPSSRQPRYPVKANLALAGVQPSDIDTILLTHAHPDHIGGLIDGEGNAVFPDAELVIHRHEMSFWRDDGNLSRASELARGNFLFARKVFDSYQKRMRMFTKGDVLPGIRAMPLPGHTAGHSGYHLESNDRRLLIWGDIVHFPQIQIARPDVSIAFDQDPQLSADTRSTLLDMVSAEHLAIAGMHLDAHGFAYIRRSGNTYAIDYDI
ncbi:MBL fold metallo-hydrolase [Brenneria sp. 4F2]|nr:MBL fold metallo-hydrolase [Brenneria bubanii]